MALNSPQVSYCRFSRSFYRPFWGPEFISAFNDVEDLYQISFQFVVFCGSVPTLYSGSCESVLTECVPILKLYTVEQYTMNTCIIPNYYRCSDHGSDRRAVAFRKPRSEACVHANIG